MSLTGALNTAVTALQTFSNSIATISTNIANINTPGFKTFANEYLTQTSSGNRPGVGGGVFGIERNFISEQGVLQSTNSLTDLALSGNGFFVVGAEDTDGSITDTRFSRQGSFKIDNEGNYVNANGDILFAWPLDSNGNLPGQGTNTNTTPSQLLDSLVSLNVQGVISSANPTTTVTASYNLDSTTEALLGATDEVDLVSTANSSNNRTDLIVPASFNSGDDFSLVLSSGTTTTFTYTVTESNNIEGGILGATDADTAFTATDGDTFTITSNGVNNVFTYQSTAPDEDDLEFSTLNNLAEAINQTSTLIARVSGSFLYLSDADGVAVSFTEGTGAQFVTAVFAGTSGHAAGWSTLNNLEDLVDAHSSEEVYAEFDSSGNLEIGVVDPTATFTFVDDSSDDMLTELGLNSTSATIGPAYASGVSATNMASGTGVTPDFSGAVRIFDAQGEGHDFLLSFIKLAQNTWGWEMYAVDSTEVTASDGQISAGTLEFDGTGAISSVTGGSDVSISWTNGASASEIDVTLTGSTQIAGPFVTNEISQNGLAVGDLAGVTISDEGIVTASFSNGTLRDLFKIPIATFANPDGLKAKTGGTYEQNEDSGTVVLEQATQRGAASIVQSALEGSTADIAQQFTSLITTQRAYQANTRVVRVADDMSEELTNIL